jgi:hypothetical protein
MMKPEAAVPPNVIPVVPLRLLPVIVTRAPPPVEPIVGLTPITVGAGEAVYVNWLPEKLIPFTNTEKVPVA